MLKFLKTSYMMVKTAATVSLLVLATYILGNAIQLENDYVAKYENAYAMMVREHNLNLVFGEALRNNQSWLRANDRLGLAFLDERAARNKLKTELEIQQYEMYTFYRVLEQIHPGAVKEVEDYLGPPPRLFPAPGFPDVDDTLDIDNFHLTPEGHHAN